MPSASAAATRTATSAIQRDIELLWRVVNLALTERTRGSAHGAGMGEYSQVESALDSFFGGQVYMDDANTRTLDDLAGRVDDLTAREAQHELRLRGLQTRVLALENRGSGGQGGGAGPGGAAVEHAPERVVALGLAGSGRVRAAGAADRLDLAVDTLSTASSLWFEAGASNGPSIGFFVPGV